MSPFFDFHHTVLPEEIDAQGHVHNLRYLQWTLGAAGAHTADCGFDSKAALEAGFGWVVRSHDITYRAAALAGNEITIRTWISEIERFASRRQYVIARPADRTVLARAVTRWVYVDLSVRKAIAIPADVAAQMVVCSNPPGLPWKTG